MALNYGPTDSESELECELEITSPIILLPRPKIPVYYCFDEVIQSNRSSQIERDDVTVARMLTSYVLTPEKRALMGYPLEAWKGACFATVIHTPYPTTNPDDSDVDSMTGATVDDGLRKVKCTRCSKIFSLLRNNDYARKDQCVYHWGKCIEQIVDSNQVIKSWTCCENKAKSAGCTTAKSHIWCGLMPGINSPLPDYVRSRELEVPPVDGFYGVYGLDCEMCFTQHGLELTQVALVDTKGTTVYMSYVKPTGEIIDGNKRLNGINANDLKTLSDVQKELATFINKDTILIGHALEGDLRVLRLLHEKCVDTSAIFPHRKGLPYRHSLRFLSKRLLHRRIQVGMHDPAEDARAAVDLTLLKLLCDCGDIQYDTCENKE